MMKMILVLAILLVGVIGCTIHSLKAKRDPECGASYWRNIKWAIGYAFVALVGFGFSLDYFEPTAPTIEQLNDNPAWHNWLAGGIFVVILAVFAYFVWKKIYKK